MGKRESAEPKRAKNAEKKPKKAKNEVAGQKKTGKIAAVLLVLLTALTVGVYLLLCSQVKTDRLLERTYIDGVDVSGMTLEEADGALQSNFDKNYSDASVTLQMAGESYEVSLWRADHTILWLDTEKVLEEAMSRSNGQFLTRGYRWITAQLEDWTGSAMVSIHAGDQFYEAVANTGLFQVDTRVETTYTVGEDSVIIQKGEAGVVADAQTTIEAVVELVSSGQWPETQTLDCATLTSDIAALDVDKIYEEVYTEAADATLDPDNDYNIVPSVTGVAFDVEAAKEALSAAEPGSTVEVPLVFTTPEITTENMEENLFRDVLGSYTTTVGGTSGRRSNVKLSAEYCDGTIMLVGDVFSYNDVVGQRTKARGFSEAPAYVNGETVQEVGGGICQTSSTLYAACLYANLEIVERTNHSYASSYIGLGLDATVSWGGPDYKFANNTKYPIKVVASYSSGKLTVKILGTKTEDVTVKMVSKTLDTIPYSTVTKEVSSMYQGETKTITTPYTGYKVQTYRELYDGDGNLISSNEEAYSYYKKRDKVVAKGTKKKKSDSNNSNSGDDSSSSSEDSAG